MSLNPDPINLIAIYFFKVSFMLSSHLRIDLFPLGFSDFFCKFTFPRVCSIWSLVWSESQIPKCLIVGYNFVHSPVMLSLSDVQNYLQHFNPKSRSISFSIVTRLRSGRPGFDFRQEHGFFLSAIARRPTKRPVEPVPGSLSSGIKRRG
jgi:hypothetical protein